MINVPPLSTHRRLAGMAGILGLGALLAGSPYPRGSGDIDTLARMVESEEDHISALELAAWIRDRRPGLRVIDVRDAEAFDAYAIPLAENLPVDELVRMPFRHDETVVLYSEGGAHAAQAWVLLKARGLRQVYQVRGGLYAWIDDVIEASIPANADSASMHHFMAEIAPLSRYFGGLPTIGPEGADPDALSLPPVDGPNADRTRAAVQRIRRRGC